MGFLFDEDLGFKSPAWNDADPPFNKILFPHPQEVQRPSPKCDPLTFWTLEQKKCYEWTQIPSILTSRGWHHMLLRQTELTREEPPWRPQMAAPLLDEQNYLGLRTRRIPVDFPKFCQFPVDLRTAIWAQATANDPRVFEMRHPDFHLYDQNGMGVERPQYLVKPRALTSVCIESRLQFVKVDLGTGDNYLMNLEVDIVYFGPDSCWWDETWWRPPLEEAEQYGSSMGAFDSGTGWQKRQLWNHWKYGIDSQEIGEEQTYDPYQVNNQKLDQTRHWKDPYHPLLSASHYEFERRQIKNIAVDLEFWQETWERQSEGQTDLLSLFPCAKKFILAAGDIGDSLHLKRTDEGADYLMDVEYFPRLKKNRTDRHPGVIYGGHVNFHSAAAQTLLLQDVLDVTVDGGGRYPTPVTMFVTRGGKYHGHLSRLIDNQLPPSCEYNDGDDDMDDFDDDDSLAWAFRGVRDNDQMDAQQEDNDKTDDLIDLRKIPARRELSDLLYGRDNPPSLWELEEQRNELNAKFQGIGPVNIFQAFKAFHATAPIPLDDDTEEEVSNDEDAEYGEEEDAPYEIDEDTIVVDYLNAGKARFAAYGPKATAKRNAGAFRWDDKPREDNKNPAKENSKWIAEEGKTMPVKADKKDGRKPLNLPSEGEKVGIIRNSVLHYGKLSYQVTWINEQRKHRPDKQKWRSTDHVFENDHCRALIAAFHKTHPEAICQKDEDEYTRIEYGTGKKDGVMIKAQLDSTPEKNEVNGSWMLIKAVQTPANQTHHHKTTKQTMEWTLIDLLR